jgi:peroxiredoxin
MTFAKIVLIGSLLAGGIADARMAPKVSLPDQHGNTVSLASLRGRVVLVDIWASWCPPCKAAFPAYEDLFQEYGARGFDVLAVNVDEKRGAADEFLSGRQFQMHVVFDPKGAAPAAFNVRAMPTSYLIDKRGSIRFVHEGFTDKSIAQYKHEIEQLIAETP